MLIQLKESGCKNMIKLLIIENQRLIGEGFRSILENDCEIEVVDLACDAYEAIELCKKHSPDVMLMDLHLPVWDGIEGVRMMKSLYNHIKVLILSSLDDFRSVSEALKNGADGYILKDMTPDKLLAAIKDTVKGLNIIDEKVYHNIVKKFNEPAKKNSEYGLTEREKMVIELVVHGNSNKLIASALNITEGRVKNIITRVLEKLDLSDRTSLAVFAVNNKLFKQIV